MSFSMDTVQEEILRFELMLQASDPEQRTLGCKGLQDIIQQRQGTPYARRAKRILESKCQQRSEKDPELSRFTMRRIAIHQLTHVDLPAFLDELQTKPAIAARLRRDVIKDLRQWITEALSRIGSQASPAEIQALNRFAALPALASYEPELDALRQLRHALFERRYEEVRSAIAAAVATWSFDAAWSAHQQLANAPADFESAVNQLQDEIYRANGKYHELDRLLDQSIQKEPAHWNEAASVINYVQELSNCLDDDVPYDWRQRLTAAKQESLAGVTRFLETNARKLRDFQELRTFRAKFEDLRFDDRDANISLRKEWFQSALDQLTEHIEKEVAEAESPEALDVILMGLADKQEGLPEIFIEELNAWRIRIEQISTSWKIIRTGDNFPRRMPAGEPLPQAFVTCVAFFHERLKRVHEAFAKLETSAANTIQTYVEAGETAKEILAEHSNHATALKLKEKAERKIAYHQIHRAVVAWEIDLLVELCRPRKQEAECGYYLANEQRLHRLQELVEQPSFSGSHEAAGWWQLWRARTEELPASVPETLTAALLREEENRADQWHAALAKLSESSLPPEKCDEIALSLRNELTRLDLKWRQTDFLHKAGVGYAERFIKLKQWRRAERKIAELDQEHESTRFLKTSLAVERAREVGVLALSHVLKTEWSHVSLYLKDEAYNILIAALVNAWEDKEEEALKNLRMLVTRLLTTRQAPPQALQILEQWEEWLTVESYVRTTGGLAAVKKLVSYLQAQAPAGKVLAARLQTLIDYWHEQNDLVMLAWAYEAFRDHVSLPLQLPIEDLHQQHSQLAFEYENELRHNDQLDLAALKSMQRGLKEAETEWARLADYLNELPHPTTAVTLPGKFYEVRELLARVVEIWMDLDALKNADLRLETEQAKVNDARQTLKRNFDGIAIQPKLLQQEQQLAPLTNLPFLQNRIHDAANDCGNDDKWDQKNLFKILVESLDNMIELFRRAGAEDRHLWRLISAEYCITVHARARSFLPKPPPDLSALAAQFAELQAEEDRLTQLWGELKNNRPIIPSRTAFEPESYLDYLSRFPKDPPHSRRAYIQFKRRFEAIEPMPTILSQSRRYLPEWICKYLDEGIPQYATEA